MAEDVIILNRMYVGDYLQNNIGHEVINLIKSDVNEKNPGSHYIYINAHGIIDEELYYRDNETVKNDVILLTRYVKISGIKDTVEIIAKADGCSLCAKDEMVELFKQKDGYQNLDKINKAKKRNKLNCDYIKKNQITYNGILLNEIFNENNYEGMKNDTSMFVTYKVENIYRPCIHLYVSKEKLSDSQKDFLEKDENGKVIGKVFWLNESLNGEKSEIKYQPYGTELKTYFTKTEKPLAYDNLKRIIGNKYWSKEQINDNVDDILKKYKRDDWKHNFVDILHKTNDELTYSYLLYYMLSQKEIKPEFCSFFKKFEVNLDEDYTVAREEGDIDILIKDAKNIIVIENKIKSDINGWKVKQDGEKEFITNQLHKYIHFVYGEKWNKNHYKKLTMTDKKYMEYLEYLEDDSKKTRTFFILKPEYNNISVFKINKEIENFEKINIENGGEKHIKKYIKISYQELYNHFKDKNLEVLYFKEFKNAIERHSHNVDNIQERQMFERFAERIEELSSTMP